MKPGDVLLLENLRFHAEEEQNDAKFAKELMQGVESTWTTLLPWRTGPMPRWRR